MHQQEHKLDNMNQATLYHQFRRKLIQIVISFSVFSFLYLHPSFHPFFDSVISHLSTFSSQLVSFATDKNYIFLLCNGILVFIAKSSSHAVDTCPPLQPQTSPDNDSILKGYRQSMQLGIENSVATNEDKNEDGSETDEIMEEEDVEEKHVVYQITYGTLTEKEEDGIIDDDGSKYTNENFDGWSYEEQEEEEDNFEEKEYTEENSDSWSYDEQEEDNVQEEEEEAIAKMSTEELNRKFDDFIRKMKDELRIEARQQLIVV
ncbi:hypothetical protein BVRB_4g090150 [Beta vulgaris subsp. vulgaris]|nr:hypothetical protein BVRB_4g090150 [Beta vulgaris subsp. vulgaris]